ncbi:hypothetical protein [Nonomuraea sp. NPDC049784]|uniref:hypothetical protein n=1 Tax=Nonomuraea sp. NPDC049784 TaxID=3154361 RepID=UPI0033F71E80
MTLAEIKRRVQPGQVYDVTNHYITRTDHPAYGTTRRSVTRVTNYRFYMAEAAGGRESPIEWPKAAQVSIDADGVIRLCGGGVSQKPDEPFLTLTPVTGRSGQYEGTES